MDRHSVTLRDSVQHARFSLDSILQQNRRETGRVCSSTSSEFQSRTFTRPTRSNIGLRPTYSRRNQIDMKSMCQRRAGVIPYIKQLGETILCMGIDTIYNQISDFGGGKEKNDRNIESAAIRECYEESLGIFNFRPKYLRESIYVYDDDTLIILVEMKLKCSPELFRLSTIENFKSKHMSTAFSEMKELIWIPLKEIYEYIGSDKIYKRTSKLLRDIRSHSFLF